MPFHAGAGRSYIPQEFVAADAGLRDGAGLCRAVEAIAAAADGHLWQARQSTGAVPWAALPALLPAIVAERALVRLRRADWNPFDPSVAVPDPLLTWRLAAAMLRRRF